MIVLETKPDGFLPSDFNLCVFRGGASGSQHTETSAHAF